MLKKNCSSQHTSNNPENGRQLHQKGYLIIKYPLITKYIHQRRKVFLIGLAFVKYVLHVYPI